MKKKQFTAIAMAGVLAAGVLSYGVSALADGFSTDYTITIPAELNVADAGWNATTGITANNSTNNFDTGKKLTVTATSKNGDWKLKAEGVDDTVGYNLATAEGAYSNTAEPASWEFSVAELNEASGTNKSMGIIVEDYSTKPAGNYTDTVIFTAKVESAAVAVTGVTLNKTSTTLTAGGDTETLTATVTPDNATNKTVTWTSSNTSIATVANGVVTPVAAGTATITVTTADGGKTATCAVTVNAALSKLTIGGHDFYYIDGETWGQAISNHASENSGWKVEVEDSICYGINMLKVDGWQMVVASDKVNASASYSLE